MMRKTQDLVLVLEDVFIEIWYVSVDCCWEQGFVVLSELNFKIIGAGIFEPFMNQYA